MKDLREASYILGIKLLRDRKNKTLALSQAVYIDKILARFSMENSKTGLLPFRHGMIFSKDQSPKTSEEIEKIRRVPYAEAVGSLMYIMLCIRPDVYFTVEMVSRYQSNPGPEHWTAVKHIIKYLKRTKNYMLVYAGDELIPVGYTNSDFLSDEDCRKSTFGYVFTLGSGAISWISVKQSCITDSTTEAEYVATSEDASSYKILRCLDLGRSITERKLHLVYGGGNRGLSKLVSEAAFVRGSQVLGIILRALKPLGSLSDSPTVEELVVSGDLATLEALITLASWAYLHIHPKPIAKKLFICAHTANELLDLLQAYRPEPDPWTFVLERPNNDGNSSRSKKYKLDLTLRL
ncbi:hypothetical protein WN943_027390 [Citrus x changshan-huyou]